MKAVFDEFFNNSTMQQNERLPFTQKRPQDIYIYIWWWWKSRSWPGKDTKMYVYKTCTMDCNTRIWPYDLSYFVCTITTKVVSSNPVHDKVYSIQQYVIKFVSDLRQVGDFLRFPKNSNCIHIFNFSVQFPNHFNNNIFNLHIINIHNLTMTNYIDGFTLNIAKNMYTIRVLCYLSEL
jgi:hypothetical protein